MQNSGVDRLAILGTRDFWFACSRALFSSLQCRKRYIVRRYGKLKPSSPLEEFRGQEADFGRAGFLLNKLD